MRGAVFGIGCMALGVAVFVKGVSLATRFTLTSAAIIDFLAVVFAPYWPRILKRHKRRAAVHCTIAVDV